MANKRLETLFNEADKCHREKDYARELGLRQQICELEPENPYYRHNLALALMNNDRFVGALEIFDTLVEEYPQLSRAHNNRAVLLLRIGVDLPYLVPAFLQALGTSTDVPEFCTHFMNICGAIAYGLDEGANEALDILEEAFPEVLEKVSPPEFAEKNVKNMKLLLAAYRDIAKYRGAFAQRRWRAAENALDAAKHKLNELDLANFVRNIDKYVMQYFSLCRDVVAALERIGGDPLIGPAEALKEFDSLLRRARSIGVRKDARDSLQARLLDILGWFLIGAMHSLTYLCNPTKEYKQDTVPRNTIVKLSSTSLVDLGQDLSYFLQFLERQCTNLSNIGESIADEARLLDLQNETWTRVALFCNGTSFDFRSVDVAIARDMLGWEYSPLEDARAEIRRFKSHIERQSNQDIFVDGRPKENLARALLQAFLKPRSYREVQVRGGQTDILTFAKNGTFLYETKIWRGPKYHEQGLREIEEYIIGEDEDQRLRGVFYVIFDPTKSNRAEAYLGGAFSSVDIADRQVDVVVVNLSLPKPSKKH